MKLMKLINTIILKEEETKNVEITDLKNLSTQEATKLVNSAWPEKILYNGQEFFDSIYMNKILPAAEKELGIGESYLETLEDYNDDGEMESYEEQVTIDGQSSYLGYLTDKDVFISGWDIFGDRGDRNIVYLKITKSGNVNVIKGPDAFAFGMMYSGGEGSTYNQLHKKFSKLIDLHLD